MKAVASSSNRRRRASLVAWPALLALLLGLAGGAEAAPARLASDADIAGFAALVKAYSGASRVGWAVAAPSLAEADAVIANIGLHLAPADQALLQRIRPQSAAEAGHVGEAARGPVGWIEPQLTRPSDSPACAWQVWLADPGVPTPGQGPANIPLAPNDRAPASAAATFRIAYAGLLQSKIYAFGETRPGAIRDLAIAPDVNIPVAAGETETLLLAISRQPAPFLESIRAALASSGGRRVDLGKDHALSENLLGRGRGIGANIQLVGPNMVIAKEQGAKNTVVASADGHSGELTETCTFVITPAPEAMR